MNLDVFLQDERVRMVCKMYPTKTMIGTTQQKQPDEIDDLGSIHGSSLSVTVYAYTDRDRNSVRNETPKSPKY